MLLCETDALLVGPLGLNLSRLSPEIKRAASQGEPSQLAQTKKNADPKVGVLFAS